MNVANVVILLGCRSSGCSPTEELKGRVKETVNLYRSLKEKAVIIPSGGFSEEGCGLSEAEFMLRELLKYNIPRERIFLEEKFDLLERGDAYSLIQSQDHVKGYIKTNIITEYTDKSYKFH